MAKVIWTKRATGQFECAVRYIEEEQGTAYARVILDRILHDVGLLAQQPRLGFREPLLLHRKFEYYSLVVWSYKVIYRVEKERVIISRVFHTSRNPSRMRGV